MSAGLSDGFEHYLAASEEQISDSIRNGMVVVDTNVLLDAYRFAAEARAELFGALEALGGRLWVPHQVALEFHRNRASVIAEHDAAYLEATSAIQDFRERCGADLGGKIKALAKRIALKETESERLIQVVTAGLDTAARQLEALRQRHGITADGMRNDSVLATLQRILDGKVGPRPTKEQEERDRAEASRRIAESVPPGYQDRRKADPHGDYLLWRQALTEAKTRKLPLLLVTRDVKDDWFWRVNGRTIGARPELIRECRDEAGVHFVIMTTQGFLHHTVRELHTSVSADTLRQAEALPPPSTERITFLDPKTSAPRHMAITPRLLEFSLREAQKITQRAIAEMEDFTRRRDVAHDSISRGEVSGQRLEDLLREDDLFKQNIDDKERHIQFYSEFAEWASQKLSGEVAEIPDNHQKTLEMFAERLVRRDDKTT
jgi:hypothetical protein